MRSTFLISLGLLAVVSTTLACSLVATPAPAIPTLIIQPPTAAVSQPGAGEATAVLPTDAPAVDQPTAAPQPTAASALSFTPATYTIEAEGVQLDYPSDWTAVPVDTVGSRGAQGQLFSPGSSADQLAPGGTRMAITVYLWDPKNDLNAYVDNRKTAWQASGLAVVKEDVGALSDGRAYKSYIIQTPDNHQAFFLFTTLGEKYLEISGEGNLALIEEIAKTVRPIQ